MLGMLAHPDVNSAINIEAAEHVKKGTFFDVAREKATKDALKWFWVLSWTMPLYLSAKLRELWFQSTFAANSKKNQ